jgi:hypothetical protein
VCAGTNSQHVILVVRRLRLILSLFCSLFFVVVFNVVLRRRCGWGEVEVRLRGSLSARSAIPNQAMSEPVSLARCFFRFFLFLLLQQQNSKAVTSL